VHRKRGHAVGIRQPQREGDHLFPPSAEIKNEWSYRPTYLKKTVILPSENLTLLKPINVVEHNIRMFVIQNSYMFRLLIR
jgi:hypothetical protein